MRRNYTEAQAEINDLRTQMAEIESLRQEVTTAEQKNQDLVEKVDGLRLQNDSAQHLIDQLNAEISRASPQDVVSADHGAIFRQAARDHVDVHPTIGKVTSQPKTDELIMFYFII